MKKIKRLFILVNILIVHILHAQEVTTLENCFLEPRGPGGCLSQPSGLAFDKSGNIYVADYGNNAIRKITPTGVGSTFAGGSGPGVPGFVDDTGTAAKFNSPSCVVVDTLGNVYVTDAGNNVIRKITSAGVVTTFAGSGTIGFVNGTGTLASFYFPTGIAIDASGNLYIADSGNNQIRKITPAGVVTTFAGSGAQGSVDATGTLASFNYPEGLAIDTSGNLYIGDSGNNKIRKITSARVVTTLAGTGNAAHVDSIGTLASFNFPCGVVVDISGNVYVADFDNNKIRKITPVGVVSTLAGSGHAGHVDGIGIAASFFEPYGVAVDVSGNLYVGDYGNNKIRKISNIPTAIEDQSALLNFSISPNPTSGDLFIISAENLQLIIYNGQGIKVMEQSIIKGNNNISLENYKPGLYMIQSTNGTSQSQQYKIIKN